MSTKRAPATYTPAQMPAFLGKRARTPTKVRPARALYDYRVRAAIAHFIKEEL